jgi:hypothetical protein
LLDVRIEFRPIIRAGRVRVIAASTELGGPT